jgi:hypothetical protein
MPTVDRALVRELKQREDARFAREHLSAWNQLLDALSR